MVSVKSDEFLTHGVFLELALEFFPFGDEIVDQTVDFLSVVLTDIAEAHHVDVEYNTSHNRCESEH